MSASQKSVSVDLLEDGVLWAINRVLFHPRGFALGYDRGDGTFVLYGDGSKVWTFECNDSSSEDDRFWAFETLLEDARELTDPAADS